MKSPFTKHTFVLGVGFILLCVFTACDKSEEPLAKAPIAFNSDVDKAYSRAPIVNDEDDQDFTDFCVWGNYTEGGNTTQVFTNQLVQRSGSDWVYAPDKFWVLKASKYDFSAYSPSGAGVPVVEANNLLAIDFDSKAKQVDLMLAHVSVNSEDFGKKVRPPFNHALAAVSFQFLLKGGYDYVNTYKVAKVQLSNIYTTGHFTLNADNSIAAQSTGQLGEANAITLFTGNSFTTAASMTSDPLFVIPQTGTAKVDVTIEVNGQKVNFSQKEFSMEWEKGMLYNYLVEVDPLQDISITVQTTPWDEPVIEDIIGS